MFTDTHAHLTCSAMLDDCEDVLARARAAKVTSIINICTDEKSLDAGLKLSAKYPWICNAASATPHDVGVWGESFFERVASEARQNNLIAIGETGLDYYYEHAEKALQKEHLARYVALAKELRLPLIYHCRDAFADLFAITDDHPALVHCFTGSLEEAKEALARGWYLSFSGILTFNNAGRLREVAAYVPVDQVLIETDSPYLAPQKRRGKRCEPAYLPETAACLADIKKMPLDEVARITSANAIRFFSL